MTTFRPRKPLLCMVNLRHHYVQESTEDGSRYLRCTRCGKDKYIGIIVPDTIGGGIGGGG